MVKRDGFQFYKYNIDYQNTSHMFIELMKRSSLLSISSSNNYQKDDFDEESLHFFCDFPSSLEYNQYVNADPNKRDHKLSTQIIDHIYQHSCSRGIHTEERRNRIIDMDKIFQLIETFERYDIQHSLGGKRKMTLADIARKLQIRYETVRKKHALYKKHGADFFYRHHQESKEKRKLAKRLISSALMKGPQLKYSKDISAFIKQRYGQTYSIHKINQLKRQLKQKPTFNEQADFSSICSEELGYLLHGILSKQYDIYYTWKVVSSSQHQYQQTLFFASRSMCIIRQININDMISDAIREICNEIYGAVGETDIKNYCVIAYLEDIRGDSKDLLTHKLRQNNFLIEMAVINAKVILLGEQKGKNDALPQWIEDCFMRQKDDERKYLDFRGNQNEDMKEIVCKAILYFENHLPKAKH